MPDINVIEIVVDAPASPEVIEINVPGPQGPEGTIGYEGSYSASTTYTANDIVKYNGSSWVALQSTKNHVPPTLPTESNSYWSLLAAKGDIGPTGASGTDGSDGVDGSDGAAATIAVGTVSTGDAGTEVSVTNSGTSAAAVLDFSIPKGTQGDTGPANTLSIGTVEGGSTAAATITGTAPSQTLNLTLPKGDQGDAGTNGTNGTDGNDGAAATITIGTVTTLPAGEDATVTNVGTANAAVFDIAIPQGNDGADGTGTGDVSGPSSVTDGHIAVFDGATGKLLKDGGAVFSGSYNDLTDTPTLGTAAAADTGDFAAASHTHTLSQISDASANGRSLVSAASYSAMRTLLGLVIGTNVQAYDADTAKLDVAQTWDAAQLFGQIGTSILALGSGSTINCSAYNAFSKSVSGNVTFSFSNVPSSRSFGIVLVLDYSSGTVTWPSSIKWRDDTAPTLTGGKTYLIPLHTDDGGSTWRGAAMEFAG
jgi:hypothetical protein